MASLFAATATEDAGRGRLVLVVLAVLFVGWYVLACAVWPFTACGRCKGRGKLFEPGNRKKTGRRCPRCKGTTQRLRIGRRIYNATSSRKAKE